MKKYITIAALLTAGTAFANAGDSDTLLITFGSNGGQGITEGTGAFLGVDEQSYNVISTGDSGGWTTGENALKYADGTIATGVSVTLSSPLSGANGRVETITDSDDVNDYFDTDLMGAVLNDANGKGGEVSLTFRGLTIGEEYVLYVFAGRGNGHGGSDSTRTNTYSISSGGDDITANILDYSLVTAGYPTPTENGGSITAYTQSNNGINKNCENWVLMSFEFVAKQSSVKLSAASGGGAGNFGAIGLVSVPEPSAFGLLAGIGALALVASRRRRK